MKSQRDQMKRPPLEERRAMHDIIASDSFDKAKAEAQIDKMAEQHKSTHAGPHGNPEQDLQHSDAGTEKAI